MNGVSFHLAHGQRIVSVEFSGSVDENMISPAQEREHREAQRQDEQRKLAYFHDGNDVGSNVDFGEGSDTRPKTAPVTDQHPSEAVMATDTDQDIAGISASSPVVRFTLYGGERVTVAANKLRFNGAAGKRPIDQRSGLPMIQIGNDGALNNPNNRRVDQAAQLSDYLVQAYDIRTDESSYYVFDSQSLHRLMRRGAN